MRPESAVWGRRFAIAAAIAISAIGYLVTLANESIATLPIFAHEASAFALNLATSLAAALPYVPLFIALSLIGRSDAVEAEVVVVGVDG